MCFNQPMSFAMAAWGLLCSYLVHRRTGEWKLSGGMFFFFTMEFLQGIQYWFLGDCGSMVNKFLTFLGLVHIIFQPFFTHLMCSSLVLSQVDKGKYKVILGLCVIGALWLLLRLLLHPWEQVPITDACPSTEWLRGTEMCTYAGNVHLAWSVPLYDQTYFIPSSSLHFFLMFAPFMLMGKSMVILGTFLMLTGPFLASYITPNLQEQASIWCFYSCVQTALMMLLYKFEHGTNHLPYKIAILKKRAEAEKAAKAKAAKAQ
mmetsp:Transcript_115653/g.162552  ORF Transcript_115653/g.162552 Transcript_115653/m.162552 type:complete len:260 (-) Transcript_115653:81-860(-)